MAAPGFIRGGREALGFWAIILGLCLVTGMISYAAGRDWVGRALGEAISRQEVQIKPQEPAAGSTQTPPDQAGPPPAQARVELEPREPTEAEKQDLTQQNLDAAAASGDTTVPEPSPSVAESGAPADKPQEQPSASAGYLVTAGSFTVSANAERVKRNLEKRGYHPYLSRIERRGTTYHRVIVGSYGSREQAEAVKRELEAAGFVAGVTAP